MPQAFEELAAREIDSLYQGALFLTGGNESAAEGLLSSTVGKAFHAFTVGDGEEADGRWFEARLAEEFLRRVEGSSAHKGAASSSGFAAAPRGHAPRVSSVDLHRAAAAVPADARTALWLVVLRRWSYDDAAAVLKLRRDQLQKLLDYRHAFVAEALKRRPAKNGTNDQ